MYVNSFIKDLYRVKFHGERQDVLRLDMNENPEGLPAQFVEDIKYKITPEFLATYPEKDKLTDIIADHCGIPKDCITITCGSDEAMRLSFQCFGQSNKNLVSVIPTFEMYSVYAKMFGMNHVTVEYNSDFTISTGRILEAIDDNTGIIILLNPNSPIGAVYSLEEVCTVIEKANGVGALVVIDEAYHYYYSQTFMPLIKKYPNVLVLRTFSKLCSIAGLRIGYGAGHPLLIDYMEKAQSTFNVNSVAILFAEEILKRRDVMEQQRLIEYEGRRWLTRQLTGSGYQVLSLEGNFVIFKPNRASNEIVAALKEKNVWVRDYSTGILNGFVRVSTGSVYCMERFWKALKGID